MTPADDKDEPVFVGRFNIGVVSLHLPMILAKARQESRSFYEVLDYYLELIRKIHIRTYASVSYTHLKWPDNRAGQPRGASGPKGLLQ